MASNLGFFAGGLADSTRKGLAQQEVRKRTDILQGQFDIQKQQFESDQDTKKQVQDLLAASEMNKQRAAATKDRLQGIDMMKRMRTIATQQDSATRASMVKGIVEEQKAKGVIISPTVVDMLKSGKTENLIPMINHWSAQMSASGSGGKEIMDTITNVDKSFAAIENAQFAQRNPQRAKAQQVKMFDKRIEDLGTAATKFAMNGNHQAATGMRAQQEQVIKDRARFTGEDVKTKVVGPGSRLVNERSGDVIASTPRQSKLLTQSELDQQMQLRAAGSTKINIMDKPPTIDQMTKLVGPKGEEPEIGETLGELRDKGFRVRSESDKTREKQAQAAKATLSTLERLANPVFLGSPGAINRAWDDAKKTWDRVGQTDKNLALFESFSKGTMASLIRAVGEKGNMSNQDINRGLALIPQAGDGLLQLPDTREVAQGKLKQLRGWFDTALGGEPQQDDASTLTDEQLLEGF